MLYSPPESKSAGTLPDYTNVTNMIGSGDHENLQEDGIIKQHVYEIVDDDIPISSAPSMPFSEIHNNKVKKKFPNIFPRKAASIKKETESTDSNQYDIVFEPNEESIEDNCGLGRVTLI